MNPNMFMYYGVNQKIPIEKVSGWSEKDLITTLGSSERDKRKFYIQVYDENPFFDKQQSEEVLMEVEVDIHFFESLMKALKKSGYLNTGVRKNFENKTTAKLNKNQVRVVLDYLSQHNQKSKIKFPRNTIKLFLSALYKSPKYFYIIDEFEKKYPDVIKKITERKVEYRRKTLDEEYSTYIDNLKNKFGEREEKIERVYEARIDRAWLEGDDGNVNILEDLLVQEKQKVKDEYADRLIQYNDNYLKKIENIDSYTYPTYAFKLYDFDLLVTKINKDTLRLRTIYADNMKNKPANCFLYIDDYVDIKTK